MQAKKINFISNFFFEKLQALQTCHFGKFGNTCPSLSKITVSICKKLSCLSACKKTTSPLTSFFKFCKEIANLLFGYLEHAWLRIPKVIISTRRKLLRLSACKKNQLHSPCFSGDTAKICKLLTLGTLGMLTTHLKWQYPLVENIDVYLHAKRRLHHSLLSSDITF